MKRVFMIKLKGVSQMEHKNSLTFEKVCIDPGDKAGGRVHVWLSYSRPYIWSEKIGRFSFWAQDISRNRISCAEVQCYLKDPTDGNEISQLMLKVIKDGLQKLFGT
jgi:hypothetical protein